jgi:phosphate transport system substrate-binding protein
MKAWQGSARLATVLAVGALATALVAVQPAAAQLGGTVALDGSSTVFPISEAMAEEFQKATGGAVRVTVGIAGTGGGFKKFCAGETDISNASRPILKAEIEACLANGIQFIELPVAFDGLSVMVSPQNSFVQTMSVAELRKMWEPAAQGTVTRWNQIRPEWPDREFRLFGPGADSGTFDYFTAEINGKEKASRGDFTASEDDNILVQGIANDPDALGYFGYAYYAANADRLRLVGVDAEKGAGPILPSATTIADGSYAPLSRPIFIYVKLAALDKPQVAAFVDFFMEPNNATVLIPQVGYVAFPAEYYQMGGQRVDSRQVGTVFPGASVPGVKLNDFYAVPPSIPN